MLAFRQGDLDQARALVQAFAEAGGERHQADHLLGLIACRQGDLVQGVARLRAALSAKPENTAYRLMLARALVDAGAPGEALIVARGNDRGAVAPDLLRVEAEAAARLGDSGAEISAYRRIAAAQRHDWRAWNDLGSAFARAAEWQEALEAFARARELAPAEATVRRNLAWAALTLASQSTASGRIDQAIRQLELAIAADPDSSEVALARARGLVAASSFDEAEKAFRQLLLQEAGNETAMYELGLLLERTGQVAGLRELLNAAPATVRTGSRFSYLTALLLHRDGDFAAAHRRLLEGSGDEDPERWHRLRARIADSLDRTEEAFAAMVAMNRAVPDFEAWRQRGARYRNSLRQLAGRIDPVWWRSVPRLADPERRTPAFLVGFPRSGTTLLDTFLMGHPGVRVLEELPMLEAAKREVGEIQDLPSRSNEDLDRARLAYFAELDRHVDPAFAGLVVDKLPLNLVGMPLIQALFPGAKIIFSQRHPCDAVLSGFMQSFVLNDAMACFLHLHDAADLYDALLGLWQRYVTSMQTEVHRLAYEELIADPRAALIPLVTFLGLDWDERMLDHQATAKARGAISTPSYDQVTQPLRQRPSGRWVHYRDQMEPVLPVLLKWAERLGYAPA